MAISCLVSLFEPVLPRKWRNDRWAAKKAVVVQPFAMRLNLRKIEFQRRDS